MMTLRLTTSLLKLRYTTGSNQSLCELKIIKNTLKGLFFGRGFFWSNFLLKRKLAVGFIGHSGGDIREIEGTDLITQHWDA